MSCRDRDRRAWKLLAKDQRAARRLSCRIVREPLARRDDERSILEHVELATKRDGGVVERLTDFIDLRRRPRSIVIERPREDDRRDPTLAVSKPPFDLGPPRVSRFDRQETFSNDMTIGRSRV